jgi:hypothetical protein
VVSSGPYQTLDECYQELENEMRSVVAKRIAELATTDTGLTVATPQLDRVHVGVDHILRELCVDEYHETVESSVGDMKKAYALLSFTAPQDEWLLDRWKDSTRNDRLAAIGALSGLMVGGVACLYGLLKVDTWTRGYYTKRLFIGVPAAIIGLIALAAMFS